MNRIELEMTDIRRRIASPGWIDQFRMPAFVGPDFDDLARDPADWPPHWYDGIAALRKIEPLFKLAVLAMACNEGPFLGEWIAHCRAVGVQHFFIYTNDNQDYTENVLRWFSERGMISLIRVGAEPGVNIQKKNYAHALTLLPELRLYEWVAVLDIDEFPVGAPAFDYSIRQLTSSAPTDTDTILLPWRWHIWEHTFERGPGLLADRYPHAVNHALVKPITKLNRVTSLYDIHAPRLEPGGVFRDSAMEILSPDVLHNSDIKSDAGGWVEHFWGRSFEEFIIKKARGDRMKLDHQFRREMDNYFAWSGIRSAENRRPVPRTVTDRSYAQLKKFQQSGFDFVQENAEKSYLRLVADIRDDKDLRQAFARLRRQ